jgi:hypothetical protein
MCRVRHFTRHVHCETLHMYTAADWDTPRQTKKHKTEKTEMYMPEEHKLKPN